MEFFYVNNGNTSPLYNKTTVKYPVIINNIIVKKQIVISLVLNPLYQSVDCFILYQSTLGHLERENLYIRQFCMYYGVVTVTFSVGHLRSNCK